MPQTSTSLGAAAVRRDSSEWGSKKWGANAASKSNKIPSAAATESSRRGRSRIPQRAFRTRMEAAGPTPEEAVWDCFSGLRFGIFFDTQSLSFRGCLVALSQRGRHHHGGGAMAREHGGNRAPA